jgi:hypothetical protein
VASEILEKEYIGWERDTSYRVAGIIIKKT